MCAVLNWCAAWTWFSSGATGYARSRPMPASTAVRVPALRRSWAALG